MDEGERFYITTPIFYVNDVPHIGHAYTEVAADVLARWHRLRGDDTWMLTGTDEHGEKVLRTATANGVAPKQWADRLVHESWLPLLETLDIANDDFIRTTDERHEKAVGRFVERLYRDGWIYAGDYEGAYCVGCEEFKQEDEIVDGVGDFAGQRVCAIHSRPVEVVHERNYFFKLSAFQDRLLALYDERPTFVQPDSARNEVVSFVRRGLEDLSISRTTFDWGIKVPWDPSHVVYVWFDALLNYATAIGLESDEREFARRWPAFHLVGKDILRFHAVIWPAMLMAGGVEPPAGVFAHGWLLVGGEKMSKSKLTGIAPTQITDVFGADAFRYYFLRAISFGSDGSFSWEDMAARYQAELANGFGNLASRVVSMIGRYFDGAVPAAGTLLDADLQVVQTASAAVTGADAEIDAFQLHDAIAATWTLVDALNGYLTEQEPWALAKSGEQRERLGTVLNTAAEGLRVLAVLLHPVIPHATVRLWQALGLDTTPGPIGEQRIPDDLGWGRIPDGTVVQPLEPLFPRLDDPVPATAPQGAPAPVA